MWLEKKFEKRISNWSHRWLTLGGRFTLVKVVLESIHVYWLSLAKIPKGTLKKSEGGCLASCGLVKN
jgi:hypothetical protein